MKTSMCCVAMLMSMMGMAAGEVAAAENNSSLAPLIAAQAADNYILGECRVSQPDSGAEIRPTVNGDSYLVYYHDGDPRYQGFSFDSGDSKITLVKAPAHGRVEHVNSRVSNNYYHYYSEQGYVGQDRFVMQVEKNGIKVRIQYLMEAVPADEPTNYLCDPGMWKISATTPALAI